MSAGIEVKEFKYIPGKNDAEYIKLLEENCERWKQIANSAISKLKRMPAERTEIVHCEDCVYHDWDIVDGPYGLAQEIHWCDKLYDGPGESLAVLPSYHF